MSIEKAIEIAAASWASIDYTGRWKALHYFARQFFAPVLLSCQEEGMLGERSNLNAQPEDWTPAMTLCVTNETRGSCPVQVKWALRDLMGRVKREGTIALNVAPPAKRLAGQGGTAG